LNEKYLGGVTAQKEKLEAEGHTIIQKGRKNIRYYVKDYEHVLFSKLKKICFLVNIERIHRGLSALQRMF